MKKTAFLLGRIMFGGFFLYNGINHLRQRKNLAQFGENFATFARIDSKNPDLNQNMNFMRQVTRTDSFSAPRAKKKGGIFIPPGVA